MILRGFDICSLSCSAH